MQCAGQVPGVKEIVMGLEAGRRRGSGPLDKFFICDSLPVAGTSIIPSGYRVGIGTGTGMYSGGVRGS